MSNPRTEINWSANARKAGRAVHNALGWALGIVLLSPLFWMISASFKKNDFAVFSFPIEWIPMQPTLHAYQFIFKGSAYVNYIQSLLNSLFVVGLITAGSFLTCILAAYAFSKIQFAGRNAIFMFFIVCMAVPGEVLFVPTLAIFNVLGLIDTLWALIIPSIFANIFGVFLIRQNFASIPKELTEAAVIDGAPNLAILFRIMAPLAKESIITFLLLQFTWVWNDYQGPLLWINSKENYTVAYALAMLRSVSDSSTPVLMAGSVISLMPVIVLVVFFQKYFEKNVISAGIKG